MQGNVIDITSSTAYIALQDGKTVDICLANLPYNIKIGDKVDVNINVGNRFTNDKLLGFF